MEIFIVLIIGFIVGIINGLAGGASIISFPVLLAMGLNPVSATITNALGISSANFFALTSERSNIRNLFREYRHLIFISAIGSTIGAIALLVFPEYAFKKIVPFLLLFATISMLMPIKHSNKPSSGKGESTGIFASGVYGGYFGPGQGVMVIATLMRHRDPTRVNVAKNLIIAVTGIFSNVIYLFSGLIHWGFFALLFISSSLGGYIAGHIVGRISTKFLRAVVITTGLLASTWLFNLYIFI